MAWGLIFGLARNFNPTQGLYEVSTGMECQTRACTSEFCNWEPTKKGSNNWSMVLGISSSNYVAIRR